MQTPHFCSALNEFTLLLNVKLIFLLAPAVSLCLPYGEPGLPGTLPWAATQPPPWDLGKGGVAGTGSTDTTSSALEWKQPLCGVRGPDCPGLWQWELWPSGHTVQAANPEA